MVQSHNPILLIVEDDPLMRDILELALRQHFSPPFDIRLAADGVKALEIIKECSPSLIVLDILLPQMNGLQILQQLRDHPLNSHRPRILVISALGVREVVQQAVDRGADDFLVKPFDTETLIARLKAVLVH
ncbi:MAG: Stage 0 sporulation two-component response regulator (Spo0A) [Anaerolineae bacterium]|jgi:DNA-binding response OmpR family regulator|nr:MAG: Stage 0 sporulation two-component response regulator (Spo0A) [Anaerolineae bacterium]